MRCEDVQAHLPDHLAGALTPADAERVGAHLQTCPDCAAEFEAAGDLWRQLAAIPAPRADSAGMRARFDAALDAHQPPAAAPSFRSRGRFRHSGLQAAAAAALLAVGIGIGRETAPEPEPDPQIGEMRAELREMRHMVTLSLLEQQSASERLKGVTYSSQIEQPGTDVVAALLDKLRYDVNVNVRLASIDALKRFAADESVRRGAVETLPEQTSPLVQIALIDFLVELKGREATETLRRLSMDSMVDEGVRERAVQGLELIG
jgi:hypothetical protein